MIGVNMCHTVCALLYHGSKFSNAIMTPGMNYNNGPGVFSVAHSTITYESLNILIKSNGLGF